MSRTFGPTFFTKGKLYLAPYEQTEQFRDCSKQIVKEQKENKKQIVFRFLALFTCSFIKIDCDNKFEEQFCDKLFSS